MKISTNWLKEYLDLPVNNLEDGNKLAEEIGLTSSEVEEVSYLTPQSTNLVVAKVLSVEKIADSDHLKLTKVSDGSNEYQIVTGAPNVTENQLVVLAKVGAVLYDGKEIKEAQMAGLKSEGMLVSLQEIGFTDSIAPKKHEDGIYVFPNDDSVKPGDSAIEALWLNDVIVETSLTANRADMMSIKGNAYELGAMLNIPAKRIKVEVTEGDSEIQDLISVEGNTELAPQYNLRIVQNVKVEPSPLEIQRKLWSSGIRPINNIVDVTNLVMLLFGQPMHAFDYDKLPNKKIRVGLSENQELTTLDGTKRQLTDNNIVIYDDQTPLMLAGVMGGLDSEVTVDTKNIVLESATFNPVLIRKTAQLFNLHSEASARFERGIDVDDVVPALNYAADLISKLTDGQVAKGIISQSENIPENTPIEITLDEINKFFGSQLTNEDIEDVFKRLAFEIDSENDKFVVYVPNRRFDIKLPVDLYEEIVRIHGYDKLNQTLPQVIDAKAGLTDKQKVLREVNSIMRSFGLSQAISYSLTTPEKATTFSTFKMPTIVLDYPISEDRSVLRQSIITTLLEATIYNDSRGQKNLSFFETGVVFGLDNNQPHEELHLGGIITANAEENWISKNNKFDFYSIKGIVEELFAQLGLSSKFKATNIENMHPGQTAEISIDNKVVGYVGKIHPQYLSNTKIQSDVYALEINLDTVISEYSGNVEYQSISKFPNITRDISIKVPENVSANQILDIFNEIEPIPKAVTLIDVYEDSQTYRFTFENRDNVFTVESINEIMKGLTQKLIKQIGVEIR
jgi:phenylalanyl-tRNA synthetase beta chain